MQSLQFESSPYYILLCIALGVGYAFVLYRSKYVWSKLVNQILFGLRAAMVALLAFLLLGPILKLSNNIFEKPSIVFLVDNSTSVTESIDSVSRKKIISDLEKATQKIKSQGYDVLYKDLTNNQIQQIKFLSQTSDLNAGIKAITTEYEGKNLGAIILVSDGIYNNGTSPLYTPTRVPIYTVGIGDTTDRADLILKNVSYNKITYQGNKFPIQAEVGIVGLRDQRVVVSVLKNGKLILREEQNSKAKLVTDFNFLVEATEKGIQRFDIVVDPVRSEVSKKNNRTSIFIEVVEGKKKILLIAPAPHPDIKAIRSVVEKNSNYEFILHIPAIAEASPEVLKPGVADLVIFHQVADRNNKTSQLYQGFKNSASLFLILGSQTNLRSLVQNQIPLAFENAGQWDEVTPVINTTFHDFNFPENTNGVIAKYPPIEVPFGKFSYPNNANILMRQRIGSVTTDRPLLLTWDDDKYKIAVLVGEGIWKWRLGEFSDTEKTEVFDDVFSKLFQYLSTVDDKRKFRSFPLKSEFTDASSAVIESQVYNDLFEPIYGNTISVELKNEQGQITKYQYVTSPGGSRYQIGGLKEGAYQFKSSTEINGKREEVRGQFLVTAQNVESQNLTADFGLLRKLSAITGGKFYTANRLTELSSHFKEEKAQALIHTEESFNSLINLKWFFFLLLALISIEWFLRKYLGAY